MSLRDQKWLDVNHEKTFETELVAWRRSASCVMNNGDIAMWGKTAKKAPYEFHIYNKDARKVKKMKALCQHKKNVHMLSIVIENQNVEYLAVSCSECGDINLQHLTIDTAYPAFGSEHCGSMCYGKEGQIFSTNSIEEFPVIEIGCKRKQFVYGKTVETKMKTVCNLCYISTKDILVIPTHTNNTTRDEFDDDSDDDSKEKKKMRKKKILPWYELYNVVVVKCFGRWKKWTVRRRVHTELSTRTSMTSCWWLTVPTEEFLFFNLNRGNIYRP